MPGFGQLQETTGHSRCTIPGAPSGDIKDAERIPRIILLQGPPGEEFSVPGRNFSVRGDDNSCVKDPLPLLLKKRAGDQPFLFFPRPFTKSRRQFAGDMYPATGVQPGNTELAKEDDVDPGERGCHLVEQP